MIVGAMGAGYSLGKSIITEKTPASLFPAGSTTKLVDIEGKSTKAYGDYDKFKRCILRILESQGYSIDQKENKNDSLFGDPFLSKDLAQIMNNADHIQDVFFGKTIEKIEEKQFVFYPENSQQVSDILKNCSEFRIPIFTSSQGYHLSADKQLPYRLELDLSRMDKVNGNGNEDSASIDVQPAVDLSQLDLSSSMTPLDSVLASAGIKLSDSCNRLVWNRIPKSLIEQITAVLPDGTEITVSNNESNPKDWQLFQFLSGFENEVSVITGLKLNASKLRPSHDDLFVVLGFKALGSVNSAVKEISSKLPNLEIGFVDSSNCKSLETKYGGCKTLAIMRVSRRSYERLGRKFNEGCDEFRVFKMNPIDLVPQRAEHYYSSELNDKETARSGLFISSDIVREDPVGYVATDMLEEAKMVDTKVADGDPKRDFERRIKLSLDPEGILNPNERILTK